eukprot:UN16551
MNFLRFLSFLESSSKIFPKCSKILFKNLAKIREGLLSGKVTDAKKDTVVSKEEVFRGFLKTFPALCRDIRVV